MAVESGLNSGSAQRGFPRATDFRPFLFNFLHQILTPVDKACEHLHYYRYADDVLVLGRSFHEVLGALEFFGKLLVQTWPPIKRWKDGYSRPPQRARDFPGLRNSRRQSISSQESRLAIGAELRVRGHEARKVALMKCFVNRYQIGPVRKQFRRIDRELHQYYPPGVSLTGILDGTAGFRARVEYDSREVIAIPKGKAAELTAKKAHPGQVPVAVAAGEQD